MDRRSTTQASIAGLSTLETNKVLRSTFQLLSATLIFSAMTATISMFMNPGSGPYLICLLASMGLGIFVLPRTANSGAGIGVIFLITGLLGFGLGPILSTYLQVLSNGSQVVATALGGTGAIFLGLSFYARTSKRDFTFLGGFVFIGMMVVLLAMIANIFMQIPLLSLGLSAGIIMLMSAMILMQISNIVRGGETNYIMATYSLYLSIFNIFISLLHILGVASDD